MVNNQASVLWEFIFIPRDLHRDAAFKFNKTLFIIVRHSKLPKICNGGGVPE